MKLKNIILPMLAVLMLATGCRKDEGAVIETYQFNITPAEWQRNEGVQLPGSNNYLYCTKELPSIDPQVFNYGTVQAYLWNVYDGQHNYGAWNTLPFVFPLEVYVTNEDGEQELAIVSENVRFEWELGKVTFVIQDLDGYDPVALGDNQTISFKVCITRNFVR